MSSENGWMDGRTDGRTGGGDFLPSLHHHHHHRYLVCVIPFTPPLTAPHRTAPFASFSAHQTHHPSLIPIPIPDPPCIHTYVASSERGSRPECSLAGRVYIVHTSSIMDKVPSAPEDVTVNNNFAFPLSRSRYAVSILRWQCVVRGTGVLCECECEWE